MYSTPRVSIYLIRGLHNSDKEQMIWWSGGLMIVQKKNHVYMHNIVKHHQNLIRSGCRGETGPIQHSTRGGLLNSLFKGANSDIWVRIGNSETRRRGILWGPSFKYVGFEPICKDLNLGACLHSLVKENHTRPLFGLAPLSPKHC